MITQLTPFIMLDRQANDAIRFYAEAIGAKVIFKQTFGEGPQDPQHPLAEEDKDLISHSVLKVGGAELMVSDMMPGQTPQQGNQVNICLITDDVEEARQAYEALRQNGQVEIPLGEVHFSPAYGMVTDRYGVVFQVFTKHPR